LFLALRQWKFVSAFRAFSHSALHGRWTAGTGKCSTICYVEGEAAFRAFHYRFRLRAHSMSLSLNHSFSEILKTFLEMFKKFNAAIIKSIDLKDKTVKSMIKKCMKFDYVRKN